LIAVTSHNSEVSLYSIAYPPLMPEDVYQSGPVEIKWYIWLTIFILAGSLIFVPYILIKKKKGKKKKEGLYVQVEHPNIVPIEPIGRKTISSILFMGGFQVFDHKGLNITASFSPTLKQLFLIIFLYTIKNGKGVSSAKLDEVLWYDKLGDSARNNRNVNISKLRTVLDEIGGVEMIHENSFWKIKLEGHVFCDYTEIIQLLRKSKSNAILEPEIHELIVLLSFGEFLPQIQTEWMDEFKSVFANEVIDGLSSLFRGKEVMDNFSLQYHLAECILVYDPLNDEAFSRKCSVLYQISKKGMAKSFYDSFCRKYKQVLGIDYAVSFNDTVK
jgi:two-component SAPR family response regulator